MTVTPLEIKGLALIQLKLFGDARGFFVERFQEQRFRDANIPTHYVQDNHSRSAPGVLRGLHYQTDPAQGKLVGVLRGSILDVVADIRMDSPTFGQTYSVELSDMNARMLWVPPGFAHGFCVLGNEPADLIYKVTTPYSPASEGGILWNDKDLAINWPLPAPTLSARDVKLPTLAEYRENPPSWKL